MAAHQPILCDGRITLLLFMQNQNRFRKSDPAINGLESLFADYSVNRVRNSFSNNAVSPLNLHNYRVTVSNHQIPLSNCHLPEKESVKSTKNLREQLSFLQEKLNNAKKEMNSKQTADYKKRKQINPSQDHFLKIKHSSSPLQVELAAEDMLRKTKKEQFISSQPKPNNVTTFNVNPYSSIKSSQYYLAEVIRARHEKNSLAVQHINTSITLLKQIQNIKKFIANKYFQPIKLPKLTEDKKTLFIDLDETLIHCLDNSECQPDFRLKISIEGVAVDLDITIRPYALTFLKKISKKWEVIVFTASHKDYADAILNEIDPDGAIFHHRLYRQHCIYTDELYVKDLSRVNRDLSKVVLVDNAAYSYCLQLANGIPILPYYDGKDFELSALEGYLARLEKLNDVRVTNYQYFKLDQYSQFESSSQLIEQLYLKSKQPIFI